MNYSNGDNNHNDNCIKRIMTTIITRMNIIINNCINTIMTTIMTRRNIIIEFSSNDKNNDNNENNDGITH